MSDYGADQNPDIIKAQDLAFTKGLLPLAKTNVMQWTYPDDETVRKLANKTGKSNVLVKFAEPPPPGPIPPELDPVPAGNACANCWGNGRPFGVGETPDTVVVVIENVEKGPGWMAGDGEPPNGTFDLAQRPVAPCRFRLENDDFIMLLQWAGITAQFNVRSKPAATTSFFALTPMCNTFFENTVTDEFIGGTATVFIPPIA